MKIDPQDLLCLLRDINEYGTLSVGMVIYILTLIKLRKEKVK